MKCNPCGGTGKEKVTNGEPDNLEEVKCIECKGTGERNIVLTVTLWDEDNEREIAAENVSLDFSDPILEGTSALRRLVKYAEENKEY